MARGTRKVRRAVALAGAAAGRGSAVPSLTITLGTTTGAEYYIAPTGSDTTGDGSIGSPWRTLGKFYDEAAAGDTLYCRGGTYSGDSAVYVTVAGTAGSPITVRNYPAETPLFSFSDSILYFNSGAAYHVVDGLQFTSPINSAASMIWVGNGLSAPEGPPYTGPVTFRNCTITKTAGGRTNAHGFYLSWWATDVLIEDCILIGCYATDGMNNEAAVHIFHDPCAINTVVDHTIMDNWSNGVLAWDGAEPPVLTASFTHNSFVNSYDFLDVRYHSTILIRDNAGDTPDGGSAIYDPNDSADTTADHNFWDQSFDAGYYLVDGQSGRSAASDGSDAGALDW